MASEGESSTGGERLLNRRELRRRVPVSDMTIWRWEAKGLFPAHLSIGGRSFWRESEVRQWIDEQSSRRFEQGRTRATIPSGLTDAGKARCQLDDAGDEPSIRLE
jgi:predicted DNA-binding transcriptional regulator AlpA